MNEDKILVAEKTETKTKTVTEKIVLKKSQKTDTFAQEEVEISTNFGEKEQKTNQKTEKIEETSQKMRNAPLTARQLEYEKIKNKSIAELEEMRQMQDRLDEQLENRDKKLSKQTDEPGTEVKQEKKSSLVIEKPNYELMQRPTTKVITLKKGKQKSKPKSKLKYVFFTLCFFALGGVIAGEVVEIASLEQNYIELNEQYDADLTKLIKNIENLDLSSDTANFIEKYPDAEDAGKVSEQTNWFDKLCNFLSNLFGG